MALLYCLRLLKWERFRAHVSLLMIRGVSCAGTRTCRDCDITGADNWAFGLMFEDFLGVGERGEDHEKLEVAVQVVLHLALLKLF